ncbi:MAG: ABC transporter permease [Bryobacteraceae bacterium]
MLQDLRLAIRILLKQPGFTLIAVLTLALGIGATSSVFSLIQGVLLTPPPYRQPQRLVLIPAVRSDRQPAAGTRLWPALQWMDWQNEAKTLEAIAAYGWTFNFLVSNEGSESLQGMWVTKDYFAVVGAQPVLGRAFNAADTKSGAPAVIILGHELWQRKFNGDPNIVGRTIHISRSDTPPTVIGVMPPAIRFLPSPDNAQEPNYDVNAHVDFWRPAAPQPTSLKAAQWNVIARLKDGVSPTQAQAELSVLVEREALAERDFAGFAPRLKLLSDELNSDGRRILLPLLAAAGIVLLIACGNAAALLLVRGLQRQQEYAIRTALGVSRGALFRQVSTESLILALAGGTLGIALAFGIVRTFKLIGGHAIPRLDAVTTGWPVLACGLASAILAAVLAALFPAFRASRLDTNQVLKSAGPKSSAGLGERRLLRAVTLVQTALTLALLVGAGLLIQTMVNLSKVQSGYNTSHILTMSVTAVQGSSIDFHRRALDRVSALPGVQQAAFAWGVPLTGTSWPGSVEIEGQPIASKESDRITMPLRSVSSDYFTLLGLGIAEGRDFRASDGRDAPPVAIVNQAFADRYFPKANSIGKKLWTGGRQNPATEVIAVVANGRTGDLTVTPQPEIYLSFWQATPFSKHLVIRTASDPQSLISAVQKELRAVDPTVAVEHVKTLDQIRGDSLASRAFAMQLLAGFALVGSVLTLVGIYGVLALSVASRRREIAIRTAVGAAQADIRNLVLAEGFRLIAGGLVAGVLAAAILSRALKSFLYGISPSDPATLIGVAFLFAAVSLLACWVPTRRAIRVDPSEALRYE